MEARVVVLVAVLAVTAGCSGLLGEGPAVERTETLTPAPVAGGNASQPSAEVLPPGVRPNGTIDPDRLVRAHRRSLEGRSYTWVLRQRQVTSRNASMSNFTNWRRVEADRDAILVADGGTPVFGNRSRYVTDDGAYLNRSAGIEPRVVALNEARGEQTYDISGQILRSAFTLDQNVELSVVERDGQQYVRVHAPPKSAPAGLFGTSSGVFRYTVTAYVTPDGFVETMASRYDFFSDRTVFIRFSYDDVGATTVTRPGWVSRAQEPPNGTPTATPGPNATASGNATTPGNVTAPRNATVTRNTTAAGGSG